MYLSDSFCIGDVYYTHRERERERGGVMCNSADDPQYPNISMFTVSKYI